ncbi:hypothetical protein NL676_022812 [Syzygium grande]|nr:hypothetical protein NL676_022812 [Syzygium grande]
MQRLFHFHSSSSSSFLPPSSRTSLIAGAGGNRRRLLPLASLPPPPPPPPAATARRFESPLRCGGGGEPVALASSRPPRFAQFLALFIPPVFIRLGASGIGAAPMVIRDAAASPRSLLPSFSDLRIVVSSSVLRSRIDGICLFRERKLRDLS